VGQHGFADEVVPLSRWELARDDDGATAIAILEDLEEITPLLVDRRGQAPVIEEQDIHARELAEQAPVGAVRTRPTRSPAEARSAEPRGGERRDGSRRGSRGGRPGGRGRRR